VDYLSVDPIPDSVLGVRLEPHAGGHDAWGYRNHTIPDSAEIVLIGDSQTYGVSAPARLSWPEQLGRITGQRVFNLALGGYGPVQYAELLRTRALSLHPSIVVVGFYFGNDLADAYRTVYGLDHWAALRAPGFPTVSDSAFLPEQRDVLFGAARDWLARHSVVYRLTTFTALGGLARGLEFAAREPGRDIVPFRHPVHGGATGFTPGLRLAVLDQGDSTIREGLRLTQDRLEWMGETCDSAGVHLLVALIPTKERVYESWIMQARDIPERETFRRLAENEHAALDQLKAQLDRAGVRYLDLAAPLSEAAASHAIYPANDDGHPNGEGYATIAQAVARAIADWLPSR
jgi:lysophospholipase L1-like esterase